MASSLIASINYTLHYLDTRIHQGRLMLDLKIGLRNLKALLIICFRKLGDVHIMASSSSSSTLPSLFSRIEAAIRSVSLLDIPIHGYIDPPCESRMLDIACELCRVWKRLDEEWCLWTSGPLLTVGDAVAIADSIVGNCFDFLCLVVRSSFPYKVKVKVIDGFQLHIQFLRNFLVFANRTGVPLLHDFLILVQPIAISAARVFSSTVSDWIMQVQLKCSKVNGIVAELEIYDAYARALSTSGIGSQYAGMDDDILIDFLDSLKSLLWDVLRHSGSRQDALIASYESLRTCRAILKQKHPITFDGKIKGQIGGWIRDAGSLICSLHHTRVPKDVGRISDLLRGFDAIKAQFQNTPPQSNDVVFGDHSKNINICHGDEEDLRLCADSQMVSHQPPQTTNPQVVGFQDDEVGSMLDRLIRGSKQLRIVPICGMPGIGKTTFALKLYNLRSIIYHFQARAWCSVSQLPDKKKLLVQLLNQIHPCSRYSKMTEDDLANNLRRSLKGKRYLILLDDVWTREVWNSLETSFPDDSTHSRIVLTSRYTHVAPHGLLDGKPHSLRPREDHECFEILKMKLSGEEGWSSITGMKIAKLCKGLPLVVVIVAGLLASVNKQGWWGIMHHLSYGGVSREEQCTRALELSFMHLPDDLKLCFIYIGAFPEDEQISVKKLIRLWMAEGFVKRNGLKTKEVIGREYLESLIERSLVMVGQSRSTEVGVKWCKVHDIMHDFCVTKARQENSFHFLHGKDQLFDFNQPHCLQRLCIHSFPIHLKNSKLFCPRAQTLLFFSTRSHGHSIFDMLFIVQILKLVKVLDIENFCFVAEIPSEIEFLSRLTYLSVQSHCPIIPFSIGNLSELETFIIDSPISFEAISFPSFPDTFWNLQKLKYLQFQQFDGFNLPMEKSCNMLELEALSCVAFSSDSTMEEQLRKFPNIRRLKCRIAQSSVKVCKIVVPGNLNKLQSLSVSGTGKLQCEFCSTQNLRKVTLQGFRLCREEIALIGKLANLKVLKLLDISFPGGALEMEEGDFSKLESFHLQSSFLKWWTTSDEQLPDLRKLALYNCSELVEIPSSCLENSPTLEEIEVHGCSSSLEILVRDIEAVHEDFGNFVKVSIHSHPYYRPSQPYYG